MKIVIQTPNVAAGDNLLAFVREKVSKLEGISDRLLETRVFLKVNKSDIRENKVCEIRGVIPGNDLFAERQAASFEEATLKAVEALKRQITDWKKKNEPRSVTDQP